MIIFIVLVVAFTAMVTGCAVLIQKKMIWGYRGELFILASCVYFVGLFSLAQYTFSDSAGIDIPKYAAEIVYEGESITIQSLEQVIIPVRVKNVGTQQWNSLAQTAPVFMSYHILTKEKTTLSYDNPRVAFNDVIKPGETASLEIPLHTLSAGTYVIQLDLVAEHVTWFQDQGTRPVNIILDVSK